MWTRHDGRIVRHERDGVLIGEYEWDAAGRLTAAYQPDNPLRAELETYAWDADGSLREHTRLYEDGEWWWQAHVGDCPRQHWRSWGKGLDVEPSPMTIRPAYFAPEPPH